MLTVHPPGPASATRSRPSGLVVRARSGRTVPESWIWSRASEDKPGSRTSARSRRHQPEDHRPNLSPERDTPSRPLLGARADVLTAPIHGRRPPRTEPTCRRDPPARRHAPQHCHAQSVTGHARPPTARAVATTLDVCIEAQGEAQGAGERRTPHQATTRARDQQIQHQARSPGRSRSLQDPQRDRDQSEALHDPLEVGHARRRYTRTRRVERSDRCPVGLKR
jgi:hypothetical protein